MATYNFYFESGSRAYVLHMCDDSSSRAINVIRENTNARDELLILQKSVSLISYEGKDKDRSTHLIRISAKANTVDFYYDDEEIASALPSVLEHTGLSIRQSKFHVRLFDPANNKNDLDKYIIHIHYKNYEGTINVVCAPASQTYDVVLDFGSEASQMLIHRNDSGIRTEPIELFKRCAKHFFGIDSISPNEYDQQDVDNKLFRSVFFSSNNNHGDPISHNEIIECVVSRPSSDDKLISFITRRDKRESRQRIPNVKISYLTDLHPAGLSMRVLHQGMVMRFIHEALCHISEEENFNLKKSVAVRLTLLIPNVMCQNDVSDFVNSIQEYLGNEVFLKQTPKDLDIAIFEVRTCSESDASLLNWINKETNIRAGRYLIIDIGKGTTDFSVVDVKSATQTESIFRAGFVGAGNVLSYAILDNYITHMAGASSLKRRILMEKLMKAEPAMLYRLEQVIEKIKRDKIAIVEEDQSLRLSDVNNIQVETLIERIETASPLSDKYNIIADMIHRIVVKEIVSRVKNLKFDHVVLSGRAFMYESLYNEVCEDLRTVFPNIEIHYSSDDAKKGCLYGPLTPINISNFSNMVGRPQSVNISVIKNSSEDIDSRVESLKIKSIQNDPEKRKNVIKSIAEAAGKFLEYAFPSDDSDANDDSLSKSFTNLTKNPNAVNIDKETSNESKEQTDNYTDIMKTGVPIKFYGTNTRFYISGNSYVVSNANVLDESSKYFIYFDGDDFYLKTETSCWLLRKDPTTSKSSGLLFESLFPYSVQLLGDNIDIPISKAVRR